MPYEPSSPPSADPSHAGTPLAPPPPPAGRAFARLVILLMGLFALVLIGFTIWSTMATWREIDSATETPSGDAPIAGVEQVLGADSN